MKLGQNNLITDRRLWPILVTQACTCFNDSLIKSAVVILIAFTDIFKSDISSQILIAFANMILILPFILFAGIAGQIADKFEKSQIVRLVKIAEVGIVLLSIYAFTQQNLLLLFACIGLMGTHSAFFVPIKYSIIPEQLEKDELMAGNGYIESFTFIAILVGILCGGFAVNGISGIYILMLAVSILGLISSFAILPSVNISPDIKLNFNLISENFAIVKYATAKKQPFLAILGISWFWFVTGAFMTQIPWLTREIFWADHHVANFFSAIFSIGVGLGAFLYNRIFGHEIQTRYVFLSSIMMTVFGIDLFFASKISESLVNSEELRTLSIFLSKKYNWRILVDFLLLSIISGFYIVPLYTVLQWFSPPAYRSRIISANNLINSLFMIASNVLIYVLVFAGCSVTTILLIIFFLNGVISCYMYQMIPENTIIPESLIKMMAKFYFDTFHRVEVKGIENYAKAGKRVVIVANHPSYMEPPLLAIYLPEKPIFAIRTRVSDYWWVRPLRRLAKTYPVDTINPMAIKDLIGELKRNKKIVIFPEGRRSTTGSLMKIYDGPGMIADKSDSVILPVRIDGTQFAATSRAKHIIKNGLFPKITITILPPIKIEASSELEGKQRRRFLKNELYNIMSSMMFESSEYKKPLFESLVNVANIYGRNLPIIKDSDNTSITYGQLISRSIFLGRVFAKYSGIRENVGIMLPTSCAAIISFYGLQAYNRVPAMINFTSGVGNIISACVVGNVKTIITSRAFILKAELTDTVAKLEKEFSVIYLEDIRSNIRFIEKIKLMLAEIFPSFYYKKINNYSVNPDEMAVILFTSGTEGSPKAVALSHTNILSNTYQMSSRVDFHTTDLVFNPLPIFHSFGLMAGCIMPISVGVKVFCYPSPLHYRIIPELVYDHDATIIIGTDTFFRGYAKYADPYDFYSIRYAFAGAERLNPDTRQIWFDKFGVKIFEGYGITETSPVVSVNTPMHCSFGSVGRLLPQIEYKILPVEGFVDAGRLCLKGPNIMLGYIHPQNPGIIDAPKVEGLGEGWYDTGDIVSINEDGYITIKGRAKRFAKIAGEMVSLASVEDIAFKIDGESAHAAIHIPDDTKGEQIILFTESKIINKHHFIEQLSNLGISNLLVPKIIQYIDQIPVLSTGKTNYRDLLDLGQGLLNENLTNPQDGD